MKKLYTLLLVLPLFAVTSQAETEKTKSDKILKKTINRHAVSTNHNKKNLQRYTIDDIFFKASQPNIKHARHAAPNTSSKPVKITTLAKTKLGNRYVWGATGKKNTFDCSGLTTYVYRENGISLPRRAIAQSKVGKRISRENLKKGDLVFFDTSKRRKGYVNHVGIYMGNGQFIHASSAKKKVIITSLNKPFYSKRFKGARRLSS